MQRKRDISFCIWNVRSLHRAGWFSSVARELARYKLDLVGVQEVRWVKRGTVKQWIINFSVGKETNIISWEQDFLHHRKKSVVKKVEYPQEASKNNKNVSV
jgi:hypothetical protein